MGSLLSSVTRPSTVGRPKAINEPPKEEIKRVEVDAQRESKARGQLKETTLSSTPQTSISSLFEKVKDPEPANSQNNEKNSPEVETSRKSSIAAKMKQDSWVSTKSQGSGSPIGSIVPSVRGRRGSVKVNLTVEEHAEAAVDYTFPNPSTNTDKSMRVVLQPHVHTLFCERKERVCLSHGKLQEHERLSIMKDDKEIEKKLVKSYSWYRTQTGLHTQRHRNDDDGGDDDDDDNTSFPVREHIEKNLREASFEPIEGTVGMPAYTLTCDDVDCFLKFAPSPEHFGEGQPQSRDIVGPVLPGPPRTPWAATFVQAISNRKHGAWKVRSR